MTSLHARKGLKLSAAVLAWAGISATINIGGPAAAHADANALLPAAVTLPSEATPESESQSQSAPEIDSPPKARGVIRPGQTAEIAAGISGKLTSAPFRAGQYFAKGAALAEFDCRRQHAEKSAAQRAHQTFTLKHENIAELYSAGAAGALETRIAKSEMEQAEAEKDVIEARLTDCIIYAPFSGYVLTQHVHAHETPSLNAPLYSILKANSLEISVIAPSAWMRWIKRGSTFAFTVDETGGQFRAKIIRINAAVDPVSQTIEMTARPMEKIGRTLAGMSGVAVFAAPPNSTSSNKAASSTAPANKAPH